MAERRIAIIGGGRIGEALLSGLLTSGWRDIVVTSRREERVAELHERHEVEATTSNPEAGKGAALGVIAGKPQGIEALVAEIRPPPRPGPTRATGRAPDPA